MKYIKLFEGFFSDDSQTIDLSKFVGDVSSEDECILIHQQEDSYYAVLADKETCFELQKMGKKLSLLDEDIYRTFIYNTPESAFVVINNENYMTARVEGISMKVEPKDNAIGNGFESVIAFDLSNNYEVVSGDDSDEMNYYVFPLKRGAVTHLYQGTTLNVISIQDLVDEMNNAIESQNF
jgi:hypothetical protein